MRWVKFFVSLIITVVLLVSLLRPIPPATFSFGQFLDPFHGFWQNAEPQNPVYPNEMDLPELDGQAQVVYDERGVPHIFAQTIADAVYIQGYITARDRLWQMEFQVMDAAGRLSEIIGRGPDDQILNRDRGNRRKGMVFAAERALKVMHDHKDTGPLLDRYTAGVNHYLDQLSPKDYPLEYKILNYHPEKWSPLKTCLLMKYMAHNLSFRGDDIAATQAYAKWGPEWFNILFPEVADRLDPIVPPTTRFNSRIAVPGPPKPADYHPDSLLLSQVELLQSPPEDLGSNNWAIAGRKSSTGKPILANDPHLGLNLPAIWYEIQIQTNELNTYGVSLPGAPGIVIGFNDSIAWGVTNAGVDVIDYYKTTFRNDQRDEYLYDGQWLPVNRRAEAFQIKGGELVHDTVLYTNVGPIIYDQNFGEAEHPMALRWMAHEPSNEMLAFLGLMKAQNYAEYEAAISHYICPAQNFVFASASGDIAIWQMGKYINRWQTQGRFVLDGTRRDHMWLEYIPWQQQPHSFNPGRGFVSSANQRATSISYPYYYKSNNAIYRGRRINQLLSQAGQMGIDEMKAFQLDNYGVMAADLLPVLLGDLDTISLSGAELQAFEMLKSWDYQYLYDQPGALLFEQWYRSLYELVWMDEIDQEGVPEVYPGQTTFIDILIDSVEFRFYRDAGDSLKTNRPSLVNRAFREAIASISEKETDPAKWAWNLQKQTDILHLMRVVKPFNRMGLNTHGNRAILNATSRRHGPSWRVVVALGDEPEAYGIYPGGQSGNPGSWAYDAFVDDWVAGNYYPLWLMKGPEDQRHPKKATVRYH